jgi:hypothetical protein
MISVLDKATYKALRKSVKKGDLASAKQLLSYLRTSCATDTTISQKLLRRLVNTTYKYVPKVLAEQKSTKLLSLIRSFTSATVALLKVNTAASTVELVFT